MSKTTITALLTVALWCAATFGGIDFPPEVKQAIILLGGAMVGIFARDQSASVAHEAQTATNTAAIVSEQKQIDEGCEQAGQAISPKEGGNG